MSAEADSIQYCAGGAVRRRGRWSEHFWPEGELWLWARELFRFRARSPAAKRGRRSSLPANPETIH